MHKLWGVGLSRTGTMSLHNALRQLGFRSFHNPPPEDMFEGDFTSLQRFDAAMDIPIARWYRELDAAFPKSRFILTAREPEAWADGLCRHLNSCPAATRPERARRMRVEVYGSVHPSRDELLHIYNEHHQKVTTYFAGRPDDLLVMNVCDGQGWETLCPFLERDIPELPFPHEHRVKEPQQGHAEPQHAPPQVSTG